MKKTFFLSVFAIILLQCCKKEETLPDFRDKFVGSYKCSGKIYGFRGTNQRDTSNIVQFIEKYSDSSLILKYSFFLSGFEAVDTVSISQDSFLKADNAFSFYNHGGSGSSTIHCIDGLLKNDSIFIGYRYAGCLNPAYSYFINGPKN